MSKPTTGRLAITAWRNDDYFEYPLRIVGLNASALVLKMEIRRAGDTGGPPRVRLDGVNATDDVAQGLRVAGVSIVDGVEVSDVRIRMDRGTLQELGYQGARGDAATFEYALLIGGRTRLTGPFVLPPHAFGSDAAPLTRPESYGLDQVPGLPNGGATLTISADGGATVLMDGADLVSASIVRAEDAAEQTAADRDTVEGIASTSYQAVPTYAAREAIPLAKRQNGMRVQVMEGTPRVFEWRTDLYMPGAWVGQYTPAEIKNLGIDFTGQLAPTQVEGFVDAQDAIDSIAAIDIAGFRATALSGDANPKVELAWEVKGTPTAQTISWGSSTIAIAAAARTFTPKDWAAVKPIFVVGNSLSTSTDTTNRWSQLLAADRKQPLYSVARYTSDWSQVYRSGAAPLYLTIAGGALPAGGTAAAVTLINGSAPTASPSANPASFLNTGDGGLTTGVSMAGTIVAGTTARHVTVSIPNAASTAYSIVQDAGAAALPLTGPALFIPDVAKQIETSDLILWTGNNYYYSGVGNQFGDYTNPQMWVDMARIVAVAAGNRVLILPILPAADEPADGTPNPNVPGEKYHLQSARAAANARTETLFPTAIARDAAGRTLLKRLQDSGNGTANDNADIAAGLTPRSLRTDALHLNAAGDAVVYAFVKEALARQALPSPVIQGTVFTLTAMGANPRTGADVRDTAYAVVRGGELAALLDPLRAAVDGVVSQAAYRPTLASAVADFEVGTFFTSRDMDGVSLYPGEKRQYEIIAQAPYWADRGPFVGKADVGLDQADNTSDEDKPTSTAQQASIDQSVGGLAAYTGAALDQRVRLDAAQNLSPDKRAQGRSNLDAPSTGDLATGVANAKAAIPFAVTDLAGIPTDGDINAGTGTDGAPVLNTLLAGKRRSVRFPGGYDPATLLGSTMLRSKVLMPHTHTLQGDGFTSKFIFPVDNPVDGYLRFNTDADGAPRVFNAFGPDSKIAGLYFDARAAAAAGKKVQAILYAGNLCLEGIYAYGLQTLTKQANSYADLTRIARILANAQPSSDAYIHDHTSFESGGDGLVAEQLSTDYFDGRTLAPAGATPAEKQPYAAYSRRTRHISLRSRTCGRISQIINGDIKLYQCARMVLSNLHLETGKVTLIETSASIRDSQFYMRHASFGELSVTPVEIVKGPNYSLPQAPVDDDFVNHDYCYRHGLPGMIGVPLAEDPTKNSNIGYDLANLPNFSLPVGLTGPYLMLKVSNVARHQQPQDNAGMGPRYGVTCGMADFDAYSHFASIESRYINAGWSISAVVGPLIAGGASDGATTAKVLESGADDSYSHVAAEFPLRRWQLPSATYYYKAVWLYDKVRLAGMAGTQEVALGMTRGGYSAALRSGFSLVTQGILRIYRGTTSGQYDKVIDLPVLAAAFHYDNGLDIGGYLWRDRAAGPMDAINSGLTAGYKLEPGPRDTTSDAYGRAIVYSANGAAPTQGGWRKGDKVLLLAPYYNGSQIVEGFVRMTDCTLAAPSHVVGTDWIMMADSRADFSMTPATTAAFTSKTDTINTKNKYSRKPVYNSDTKKVLYAGGGAATDPWYDALGTLTHTPA